MKISISGKPIPKARARYSKRGKYVITYDPQDKEKKAVQKEIANQLDLAINTLDRNIFTEASNICLGKYFVVSFNFYLPINNSDTIAERNSKLWGLQVPATKPDYDNLEKFYLDCLNGIIWADDSLVIDAEAHKRYSEEPRVEIEIRVKQVPKLSDDEAKVLKLLSPNEITLLSQDVMKLIYPLRSLNSEKAQSFDTVQLKEIVYNLSTFACKYAKYFNKIEKIGDLRTKEEQVVNLIHEIDEGLHAI
jgi:Holliday junction resolvase RusA-like endonuclease